jgi:hypothetical protein
VANKAYIERLTKAIEDLHGVSGIHLGTEHITKTFKGQTVWDGDVEIFTITGHPEARMCYAWSYEDGSVGHFAAILGLPPVRTAHDAVRVYVAGEIRKQRAN